jgi:hypothetical protein
LQKKIIQVFAGMTDDIAESSDFPKRQRDGTVLTDKPRRPGMKKGIFAFLCAAMLLGTVVMGYAQRGDWRGDIRARIHDAKERIERGINQGLITRHEARSLHGELDGILHKIDRMKSDGHLSPKERDSINRDIERLNRRITREKRDDDRRRRY